MLFYRLAIQRLIKYFQLDELFKEDETRLILLHKKPKVVHRTTLNTNQTLNFYVSVLLSLVGTLICLTIPFAAMESPCEILKEKEWFLLYRAATVVENNLSLIDNLIIIFSVILVIVATSTVIDAIRNTNISVSPWIERGKYYLPPHILEQMQSRPRYRYRYRY